MLVKCTDSQTKQYILYLQDTNKHGKFIIKDLDETTLLV